MADVTTQTLTAEEFFHWCHRPENEGKRFELVKGVPTPCPLSSDPHPWRAVVGVLQEYILARRGASMALRGDGMIISRNLDTILTPDLMLFLKPNDTDEFPKRFTDEIPDLVVEILPPSLSFHRMIQRGERYIRWGGARMLWIIDPVDRAVFVGRLKASLLVFEGDELLTGNGVLPGFACRVADLFTLPGSPPPAPPETTP